MLIDDLETAVARGTFHPVLPVCSVTGLGLSELLELLCGAFPSPVEMDLPVAAHLSGDTVPDLTCDPDGPLLAEVVRTSVDPYLGRLSILRVFSGTLTAESSIHVSGHGGAGPRPPRPRRRRAGRADLLAAGATLRPVERAIAGDICAVGRLATAETGDTISAKTDPMLIAPWDMPVPLLPIAVEAATRADEDALAKALGRLTAGDPTVRIDRHPDTGQLVLWCLGEAHADVVLERLRATGAHVEIVPLRIALRETFTGEARGHGRLVKQSGGHGQYAVCDVIVTPLPRGSGVQFQDKVVGGAVPSQFIGSVEKGVRTQLEHGLDQDRIPVTDVLVTLVDGKAHSVDSSDASFQMAGSLAVKDAAANGKTALLEPVAVVDVTVPDSHVGSVLSDLSGRRGRVTGTEPDPSAPLGMERTVVHAEVPDAELSRYTITLRSLTAGTGRFTREFGRHELVPQSVAAGLRTPGGELAGSAALAGAEQPAGDLAAQRAGRRAGEGLERGRGHQAGHHRRRPRRCLGAVVLGGRGAGGRRSGEPGRPPAERPRAAPAWPPASRRPTRDRSPSRTSHAAARTPPPAVCAAGSICAINERGERIRAQATGVGAPVSDSTVTIASPMPSCCSASARS